MSSRTRLLANTKERKKLLEIGLFKGERPLIVHLGGAGHGQHDEDEAVKTKEMAKIFPHTNFILIDRHIVTSKLPENAKAIHADFLKGLQHLPQADIISSDLSLGHYLPNRNWEAHIPDEEKELREYTQKVLRQVHQKLKTGGRFYLTLGQEQSKAIKEQLMAAGFKEEDITLRDLRPDELDRTYWTRKYYKEKDWIRETHEKETGKTIPPKTYIKQVKAVKT